MLDSRKCRHCPSLDPTRVAYPRTDPIPLIFDNLAENDSRAKRFTPQGLIDTSFPKKLDQSGTSRAGFA